MMKETTQLSIGQEWLSEYIGTELPTQFKSGKKYSLATPGSLVSALSGDGGAAFEITLSIDDLIEQGYVYLQGADVDEKIYLVLDVPGTSIQMGYTEKGGKTQEVSVEFPFHFSPGWRFFLNLSSTGSIELRFFGTTLLKISTPLRTNFITRLVANVSTVPVVAPNFSQQFIPAFFVLGNGAQSTLILLWPTSDNSEFKACRFFDRTEELKIHSIAQYETSGLVWVVATLDSPKNRYIEFVRSSHRQQIYDHLFFPGVEVTASHLQWRPCNPSTSQDYEWVSEDGHVAYSKKLISRTTKYKGEKSNATRTCIPWSELLRCVTETGAQVQLWLNSDQQTCSVDPTFPLYVNANLVTQFDLIAKAVISAFEVVPREWQLVFLDWWAGAQDPNCMSNIGRVCPDFLNFLTDQKNNVGTEFDKTNARDNNQEALWADKGLSSEDILFRASLKEYAQKSIMWNESSFALGQKTGEFLCRIPPLVRSRVALAICEQGLTIGIGHVISSHVSDDFIMDAIMAPNDTWQYSTLTATLAARGEFGTCVTIIENLVGQGSAIDFSRINFGAIGATISFFCKSSQSSELRAAVIRPFCTLVSQLDGREFSSFRHAGVQLALIDYLCGIHTDSDCLQNEVISFISTNYVGVTEFWQSLEKRALQSPYSDAYDMLLSLCREQNSLYKFTSSSNCSVSLQTQHVPSLGYIGRTVRSDYLSRVAALHSHSHSMATSIPAEDHLNWTVRLLALPETNKEAKKRFSPPAKTMQNYIAKLMKYPTAAASSTLKVLGTAAWAREFDRILEYFPNVLAGSLDYDRPSEAVALDLIAWAMANSSSSDMDIAALALFVLERARQVEPSDSSSIGLASAIKRILNLVRDSSISPGLNVELEGVYRKLVNLVGAPSTDILIPSASNSSYYADTLIAIVTCRANLKSFATECLDTWVKEALSNGIRVIFFLGSSAIGDTLTDFDGELVELPVGDQYEDLPEKVIAMLDWIDQNIECQYVVKVDDDCFLDCRGYLTSLCYRRAHYFGRALDALPSTFNRVWHQSRSTREGSKRAIDTSPLGTRYADGGGSYSLSRTLTIGILDRAHRRSGQILRLASLFEDKMIGDFVSEFGIPLSEEGYRTLQVRANFSGAIPVLQVDRTFYPSKMSGVTVAHLNESTSMRPILESFHSNTLRPSRIFPLDRSVSLDNDSDMLELLSDNASIVLNAKHVCVAVFRNEMKIAPHFLNHYRKLGVEAFIIVDNLSTDGVREYLLEQEDVVLFSAASSYSKSHYGVDWQRAVLDHFCIGKWVVVADADEFLVTEGAVPMSMKEQCRLYENDGYNAAVIAMVDMYPLQRLEDADFSLVSPHLAATGFDNNPVTKWPYNRGPFGNLCSFVSHFRHRILPTSSPEMFTSQKVALFRYDPMMSFSEGFHFGAGMKWSPKPLAFLHYKYSADFLARAQEESARGQHFGGGIEYHSYLNLAKVVGFTPSLKGVTRDFADCRSEPLSFLLGEVSLT